MVYVTTKLFKLVKQSKTIRNHLRGSFIDSLRVFVKGGHGGNGLPKFGGIGGQGGSVYITASEDITLYHVFKQYPNKRVIASNGNNSNANALLGHPGTDKRLEVPVGITVYREDGKKLGELNEEGQEILVAKGGPGGHPKNRFLGYMGQTYSVVLDLKLIADIGLVGFPNAGKSTLLKSVSKAQPKIASYPFTTIRPNIGIMEYPDLRQISMADLPGLIEGAHANIGMGHKFLKHVERTKLLLLVVDINGFQLSPKHTFRSCLDTIVLLNKELELYKSELLDKPAMILINKMDVEGARKQYDEIKDKIKNLSEIIADYPEEFRPERALHFQEICPISAQVGGKQIGYVKDRLRDILNINADRENEFLDQKNTELMETIKGALKERGPKVV